MPVITFNTCTLFPSATGGEFYRLDTTDWLHSCRVDSRYRGLIATELDRLDKGEDVEIHCVPDRNGVSGNWRIDLEFYKNRGISVQPPTTQETTLLDDRSLTDGCSVTFTITVDEHEFMHRLHKHLAKTPGRCNRFSPKYRRFQDFNSYFYSQLVQILKTAHPDLCDTPEDFPF